MDYYTTKTLDSNRREPRSRYMNWTQKKEVIKDINEIALVLLEFYYSKAGLEGYAFTDKQVAKALDWSLSKVRDYRLKLEKEGYFNKTIIRGRTDTSTIVLIGHERWKKH